MNIISLAGGLVGIIVALYGCLALLEWRRDKQMEAAAKAKGLKVPPLIGGSIPVFGHLFYFMTKEQNQLPLHRELCKKYGRIYRFRLPGVEAIVSVEPEVLKHVLSTGFKQGIYQKGDRPLERSRELFGRGIFAVNGEEWTSQRDIASPLFHNAKMKHYIEIFHENAVKLFNKIDSLMNEGPIDMQDMFMRYTLDSFGEIGFGVKMDSIGEKENDFAKAFDFVQTWSSDRRRFGQLWKVKEMLMKPTEFKQHLTYMNEFCWSIIERRSLETREELVGRSDLLSILLLHNIEYPKDAYTKDQMRDYIMNFLIAGRDTTAVMLTWCVHLLSKNPEPFDKLLTEIDTVLGDSELPTWENTKDMRYVKQVLQETLRLYSPVPIDGFSAQKDDVLPGDYLIKKDTGIIYVNWVLNRLEEYYPKPDEFLPERWEKSAKPYSFLAFHGGPRQCLGMEMAYLEAKIMLCNLLRKYKFSNSTQKGHEVQVKQAIILTAKNGMFMNVTKA